MYLLSIVEPLWNGILFCHYNTSSCFLAAYEESVIPMHGVLLEPNGM